MNNVGLKNLVNEPRVREFAIDFTFCKEPTKLNLEEFAIELHFVGLAVVTKKKKKKVGLAEDNRGTKSYQIHISLHLLNKAKPTASTSDTKQKTLLDYTIYKTIRR